MKYFLKFKNWFDAEFEWFFTNGRKYSNKYNK